MRFESLLDVGCGEGRFLSEVFKRFPGKKLTGIDYSARALEYARLLNPHVRFTCGDVSDPALYDGEQRFDVITLIETLEHIPTTDVPGFVLGLRRRLNDEGALIVSVPSVNLSLNRKHYQHFTLETLTAALAPSFAVTEHHYLNRISRWDKLLGKLLVNRFFILNEPRLLNALYRRYEKSLLPALESDGKRICVVCRPQ